MENKWNIKKLELEIKIEIENKEEEDYKEKKMENKHLMKSS